jgi:hypothetical protein
MSLARLTLIRFSIHEESLEKVSEVPGRIGGGVAPAASHRSVRAQLRHTARQVTASLRSSEKGSGVINFAAIARFPLSLCG